MRATSARLLSVPESPCHATLIQHARNEVEKQPRVGAQFHIGTLLWGRGPTGRVAGLLGRGVRRVGGEIGEISGPTRGHLPRGHRQAEPVEQVEAGEEVTPHPRRVTATLHRQDSPETPRPVALGFAPLGSRGRLRWPRLSRYDGTAWAPAPLHQPADGGQSVWTVHPSLAEPEGEQEDGPSASPFRVFHP